MVWINMVFVILILQTYCLSYVIPIKLFLVPASAPRVIYLFVSVALICLEKYIFIENVDIVLSYLIK